jgi:regulator of protease activity HflC (stomatin/prohibitin superfamily)
MVNRRSTPKDEASGQNRWFVPMLIVLLLLYWLFARYLERIDLSPTINQWWQMNVGLPTLPRILISLFELFHPRVLRHLIAVLAGWLLAQAAAVGLVQRLYDLPDRFSARLFLSRMRSPRSQMERPFQDRQRSVLLRIGGPGQVNIADGEAATTEVNGRFQRVIGPGKARLERLEYIYTVVDLRQQQRVVKDIVLVTKDGIEIEVDVTLTYRVSTGGEPPTRSRPYPYDEEAVCRVAYAETVLPDNSVATWDAIPGNLAESNLIQIIARYDLDQLLYPYSAASEPSLTIQNELTRRVRTGLEVVGIELTSLHLGRFRLPDEVIGQYIEFWQAHWETQVQQKQTDGEAYMLEEVEVARAEAEITMIRAIVEGLQKARSEGGADSMPEVVALRLIEALERVAEQSHQTYPLPAHLLPSLDDLRKQLMLNAE